MKHLDKRMLSILSLGALVLLASAPSVRADEPIIVDPVPVVDLAPIPDPVPTAADLTLMPELSAPLPTVKLPIIGFRPDLRPVPNLATGRYYDLFFVTGVPTVRVRIRNVGVWPAGPSTTRVVFQRSAPFANVVLNLACPGLVPGAMFTYQLRVPVGGFDPTLDFGVRADTFNTVAESNEANNAIVVHWFN